MERLAIDPLENIDPSDEEYARLIAAQVCDLWLDYPFESEEAIAECACGCALLKCQYEDLLKFPRPDFLSEQMLVEHLLPFSVSERADFRAPIWRSQILNKWTPAFAAFGKASMVQKLNRAMVAFRKLRCFGGPYFGGLQKTEKTSEEVQGVANEPETVMPMLSNDRKLPVWLCLTKTALVACYTEVGGGAAGEVESGATKEFRPRMRKFPYDEHALECAKSCGASMRTLHIVIGPGEKCKSMVADQLMLIKPVGEDWTPEFVDAFSRISRAGIQ